MKGHKPKCILSLSNIYILLSHAYTVTLTYMYSSTRTFCYHAHACDMHLILQIIYVGKKRMSEESISEGNICMQKNNVCVLKYSGNGRQGVCTAVIG